MDVFLSHWSALNWLRTKSQGWTRPKVTLASMSGAPLLGDVAGLLEDASLGQLRDADDRLHVLVPSRKARRDQPSVVYHVCGANLPADAFWPVHVGVYASSPELCFVQMANELSLPRLVKLGYELCGSYALRPSEDGGFVAREPLTTGEQLAAFIDAASGLRGAVAARKALAYMLDGAASPAETNVAMLLTMPTVQGGYGLPAPQLNGRVDLDELAARSYGHACCFCDLYWPEERLGVEYNSDRFHTGSERIDRDAARLNALNDMGVRVVTVTRPQLLDPRRFDAVARMVAAGLGRRLRVRVGDFEKRRTALRSEIFDFKAVA